MPGCFSLKPALPITGDLVHLSLFWDWEATVFLPHRTGEINTVEATESSMLDPCPLGECSPYAALEEPLEGLNTLFPTALYCKHLCTSLWAGCPDVSGCGGGERTQQAHGVMSASLP